MRKATITRDEDTDQGSFWTYVSDSGFKVPVLGLPWRDNRVGKSHIPAGTYQCRRYDSPAHHRPLYHVENVPGRTAVEIHSANLGGDAEKGYIAQLLGCFAPGKSITVFKAGTVIGGKTLTKDQRGVAESAAALALLEVDMNDDDFELSVVVPQEATGA